MQRQEEIIPIRLNKEQTILVKATMLGGEEDVSSGTFSFDNAMSAVEGLATKFSDLFETIKPEKAKVEFGVNFSVESGKLSTLLVNGQGETSIKITLEW